jgi:hypothetical protein
LRPLARPRPDTRKAQDASHLRPPAGVVRSVAAGLLLAMVGCSPLVALGTECPESRTVCMNAQPDEGDAMDAQVPMPIDGGEDASSSPGADAARDATDPAPVFTPLLVQNRDFDRKGGVGGDLVLSETVDAITLGVPDSLGISLADVSNWYACWYGTVNSITWQLDQDAGVPAVMGDYLSFTLNSALSRQGVIEPVRQQLAAPMEVGATYAFEMDVLSRPDNGAELYVEFRGRTLVAGDDCAVSTIDNGVSLARSEIIDAAGWTTVCLQFTAQDPFTHLLIVPGYEGPQPSGNARLRLDTLRQVSGCP